MSKVSAPLLSFSASGQIANAQVYSTWKGRPYVRRYVIPANPQTSAQTATRSVFSYLNNVWKFGAADFITAYDTYALGKVLTGRNAFIQQVLPYMRGETDSETMLFSPGARAGFAAAGMALTPGDDQITVAITAPSLPSGWTIVRAIAAAIPNSDPATATTFAMAAGEDATSAYEIILSSLNSAAEYVVGGWFEYTRPDGLTAYGRSLQDTATTT